MGFAKVWRSCDTWAMIDLSRYAGTYSLGFIDREAGVIAAAVQSHAFSVGSVVPWGRPGVGVVLTQALVNREWGPEGLHLLEQGFLAEDGLARLISSDRNGALRQGAILAADGTIACHTGSRCIAEAGHVVSESYATLANMMADAGVPTAMAESLERTDGEPPVRRLIAALRAAQRAGGDIRGMQSAAILVVAIDPGLPTATAYPFDLRVEDNPEPLDELERLVDRAEAYRCAENGKAHFAAGRTGEGERAFSRAHELAPEKKEIVFWETLARAAAAPDRLGDARETLDRLDADDPRWGVLARRLPSTGVVALDTTTWDRLLAPRPGRLYHICTAKRWAARPSHDEYRDPSLVEEGFIHCSYHHQVAGVLRRFFSGQRELVVLEIDPTAIKEEVRVEDLPGEGETFPHVYGVIPSTAIVDVHHDLQSFLYRTTIES